MPFMKQEPTGEERLSAMSEDERFVAEVVGTVLHWAGEVARLEAEGAAPPDINTAKMNVLAAHSRLIRCAEAEPGLFPEAVLEEAEALMESLDL